MDHEQLKYRTDRHYRFGGFLVPAYANDNRKSVGKRMQSALRMFSALLFARDTTLVLDRKIDSFEDDAPARLPRFPGDPNLNRAQRMVDAGEDANFFDSLYDSVNSPNTDAQTFEMFMGMNAPRLPKDD